MQRNHESQEAYNDMKSKLDAMLEKIRAEKKKCIN